MNLLLAYIFLLFGNSTFMLAIGRQRWECAHPRLGHTWIISNDEYLALIHKLCGDTLTDILIKSHQSSFSKGRTKQVRAVDDLRYLKHSTNELGVRSISVDANRKRNRSEDI